MFKVTTFANKEVAVFGLGRSGLAAALALKAGGAIVLAWDDDEATREKAFAAGIDICDLHDKDFDTISALVMSPGVPIYGENKHWCAELADAKEVPIIGDIELFAREINQIEASKRPKIIGITGTNGKSTTTALIAHILAEAGRDVRIGGNIGVGVLGLEAPKLGTYYVLELSSYQLDLTKSLKCDVAILLNISPDHLQRHGTMSRYIAAKRNIFANQTSSDFAIIGVDDEYGEAICTRLMAGGSRNIIPISAGQFVNCGIVAIGNNLWDNQNGRAKQVADLKLARALPGAHNGQNTAAAFAAAKALGLSVEVIVQGIYSFGGLKHRLQEVAVIDDVRFFNDSKATNANATAQALAAFNDVHWIVGGEAKTDGIEPLRPLFGKVKKAYLIGKSATKFAKTLGAEVPFEICKTIKKAVQKSFDEAKQNGLPEVIILSPACASFDQYSDFEARGDDFISHVLALQKQV
ncbi:MAG: UDP-N-acetylmuramoyl-L-alanine--D-glutamate ligase [Pseudomonadota bacterium]